MKVKIIVLIASLFFFAKEGSSQTYTLTVNNGYGSGVYQEGDTVHVWAKETFGDTLFSEWIGSGQAGLLDGNEWHNRLVIPTGTFAGSVVLNANYGLLSPSVQIGVDSFYLFGVDPSLQNIRTFKEVNYGIPLNPKAIVFLFHGTGGSGSSFFNRYERWELIKELMDDGFAVFGVDANESTLGDINGDNLVHWETSNALLADTSNNIDIKNMFYTRDSLLIKYGYPQNMPTFSIGMSNGANFNDLCAFSLDFNAGAHITAKGKSGAYSRSDVVPIIWIASENDQQVNANNATAFANFNQLLLSQPTSEFHWFNRSPVYPERFYRSLSGVSLIKSIEIFDSLGSQGYLTLNNYLDTLETDVFLLGFSSQNSSFGLSTDQLKNVRDQFLCMNADHVLHSDFNKRIIRFFNQVFTSLEVDEQVGNELDDLVIFPNPMVNHTQIHFKNTGKEVFKFILYDVKGNIVREINNINGNQLLFDRRHLEKGVYFILLQSKSTISQGRLVIE